MTEYTVAIWGYLYDEGLIVDQHPHAKELIKVSHGKRSFTIQVADDNDIVIQEDLGHPRRICLTGIVWTHTIVDPESFPKMLAFLQEP